MDKDSCLQDAENGKQYWINTSRSKLQKKKSLENQERFQKCIDYIKSVATYLDFSQITTKENICTA